MCVNTLVYIHIYIYIYLNIVTYIYTYFCLFKGRMPKYKYMSKRVWKFHRCKIPGAITISRLLYSPVVYGIISCNPVLFLNVLDNTSKIIRFISQKIFLPKKILVVFLYLWWLRSSLLKSNKNSMHYVKNVQTNWNLCNIFCAASTEVQPMYVKFETLSKSKQFRPTHKVWDCTVLVPGRFCADVLARRPFDTEVFLRRYYLAPKLLRRNLLT